MDLQDPNAGPLRATESPARGAGVAAGENQGVDSSGKDHDVSASVIEIRDHDGVGESQNQRVCRICQLSGKDLIELGCICRGELAFVHLPCAQAWFRIRGNRSCEICGETAANITGADGPVMQVGTSPPDPTTNSSSSPRGYCNERPVCWLIVVCLAVAFVLPWYFRITVV